MPRASKSCMRCNAAIANAARSMAINLPFPVHAAPCATLAREHTLMSLICSASTVHCTNGYSAATSLFTHCTTNLPNHEPAQTMQAELAKLCLPSQFQQADKGVAFMM
eukprot:gnl/MRDRNA2_/MRDRNA2_386416_c0_seq1.p1 gnl/MRDRNA2_/MRDRNA2_386416_c0~~gnl/MRDRNA2_/MRDRNA2_386416_c0_seq1.p1  ORF type:complete len:108 (+),score=13.77 gnl/MRDRNA2_/MRDRNA2_386416_c0_seq1:98-421(+)